MEIDRISSGIDTIDQLIDGYPKDTVICYKGKRGSGKDQALKSFINSHLAEKNILIISTQMNNEQYLRAGLADGLDLVDVPFIDAANWRNRRVNPGKNDGAQIRKDKISNLTDLNALLANIIETVKNNVKIDILIFDSISSLLLYSTPGQEQVFKFFELLTSYTRSNNISMIYDIEDGVQSDQIVSALLFMSDGEVNFIYDQSYQFQIPYLWLSNNSPEWYEINF